MKASFIVRTTPQLDRLIKKLAKHHSDLPDRFAEAIKILQTDPYNTAHFYAIQEASRRQGRGGSISAAAPTLAFSLRRVGPRGRTELLRTAPRRHLPLNNHGRG
jgi:hypothetical protein